MANQYQTITLTPSGNTETKNLTVGDTLYITANFSGSNNSSPTITCQTTNCSSNVSSDSSSPYSFTITNFTSSTYSVLLQFSDSDSETTLYQGVVAGDVSSSSDTTPSAFDFTNQTGVTRSSTRTSANTVTIAGMDSGVSTAVTVSGGTYSKNGGSYTSANTTASNGTTFKLRHTSSSSYSTNTTTTLTVGGVSGSFVSTTEAAPATPSYTLTAPTSINEGSSGTINIATSNVATGTALYWSVTSTGQFTGATSGSEDTDSSGNASFSVTPTADSTTEGALTVTARIRTGSQAGPIVASDTFLVNDTSTTPTAPTALNVIITGESTAQANTTATVNLSASGSGGTLQYACEVGDSTPDNWQTSNVFNNISRGSGTVHARARRSATALSNVVTASQADFLIGDSVFSRTSPTIAHNDSSAITEVGSPSGPATAGETIAVRVDGGSTNLATGLVGSNGEVDITFSSSLPSAGNSETYRLFVRRPTNTGGDGSTFNSTGMTFTVTRSSAPVASYTVTAPTSINEGSAGSFTVSSSNAPNATLFWTVTPTSDFATSSDSFTLNSNSGSFTVTPTADSSTEGAETATIKIRSGSTSGTVLATDTFIINDTSTTPSASYTVTPPTSINEGSSGTINIATSNVATNTEIFWAVTPSSLVSGSSTSSVNTNSSGAASFSITTSSVTGNQTATVKLRTGSQAGTVVASNTFIVNETSTGLADYGVVITNANNQSILDSRTDKQSTLLKSGTVSLSPSTNQIVTNTVYVNPENAPSDVVNFGAPNTNSYTIWKATSAGTLSGSGKVGLLQTVAVTGATSASANANETGVIVVGSPGGSAFALYSFQPNASTEISDNNIAFTSFYTVSKSVNYMAVKY